MNKISTIILLTILGLVVLIIGGGIGVAYQLQKDQISNINTKVACSSDAVVKTLSSRLIASIIAYGKVSSINGTSITIINGTENTTIKLKNDAPVYSFFADKKGKSVQAIGSLSNLKKDDTVNITCVLLPNGSLEGQTLLIIPTSPLPKLK